MRLGAGGDSAGKWRVESGKILDCRTFSRSMLYASRFTLYVSRFTFYPPPVPSPSSAELSHIVNQLLNAQEQIAYRPVKDILTSIDRVVARFLAPSSTERQDAEVHLPGETGLSPEMIRYTLPFIFRAYRAHRLSALLEDELRSLAVLDDFSGNRRVVNPRLICHVLAGNLPGAGLDSIIFSLLLKSATLVKASSSASLLPLQFARSLAEVDPKLAASLSVVTWPGGQMALEEIAFHRADVVIASGSEQTLEAIRPRVRGQFIGYGHKVSFSVIAREALADTPEIARQAAYDIMLFDQQGCLSPQVIYVEQGGTVSPKKFALHLSQALAHWEHLVPRGRIPQEASLAIRRVRDETEWQALAGKESVLHTSPHGTEWTVIYEADPTFAPSPLYRTIRVKPLTTFTQLNELLAPWRPYLEAVGIAVSPGRLHRLAAILGQTGVSRVCPIGTLQTPPLSWRHGGRPRVADLVRWIEIEHTR